jgi:hypothetical protein
MSAGAPSPPAASKEPTEPSSDGQRRSFPARIRALVRAIEDDDADRIEEAILRLSRSRRAFAPLAFVVGAFVLLFGGLKLLVSNWRLMLVQILPAMWIWLVTYDLKAHVLHGRSLHVVRGPVLIPIWLAIIGITVASFFLNGVFAFAISHKGRPSTGKAFKEARSHMTPIAISGTVVGIMLAAALTFGARAGRPWFALSLGIVVALMMICYVAVPARLIGVKPKQSKRDKLAASAVGGAIGATVCTPPYLMGRLGILMLGSKALLIPGIFVLAIGATLQAGTTGAVRAIKMSTKLTGGEQPNEAPAQ